MSKGRKKSTPHETIRLSGRNVYTDKRKRTIYYDRLTKQGYLIHKQNENRMLFFQNRLSSFCSRPSCVQAPSCPGHRPFWPV